MMKRVVLAGGALFALAVVPQAAEAQITVCLTAAEATCVEFSGSASSPYTVMATLTTSNAAITGLGVYWAPGGTGDQVAWDWAAPGSGTYITSQYYAALGPFTAFDIADAVSAEWFTGFAVYDDNNLIADCFRSVGPAAMGDAGPVSFAAFFGFQLPTTECESFTGGGPSNVVPEPATWFMMATGLLAIGGAAWRRREEEELLS